MVDFDDGPGNRLRRVLHQHDATCARLEGLCNGNRLVYTLEHQHFHVASAREPGKHLERVQRIWKKAEKNDIGPRLIGKIQRMGIGGDLATHFHTGLSGIYQTVKPQEHQGPTIDQHHAYDFFMVRHYLPASHEKRSMSSTCKPS
ncbi:hypothetical protein D3C81_1315690 [compost metagenome]